MRPQRQRSSACTPGGNLERWGPGHNHRSAEHALTPSPTHGQQLATGRPMPCTEMLRRPGHVLRAVSLPHQYCPCLSPMGRPGEQNAGHTSSSCKRPKRASGPPDEVRDSGPEGGWGQSRATVCPSTRNQSHPNLTAAPEGPSAGLAILISSVHSEAGPPAAQRAGTAAREAMSGPRGPLLP